MKEIEYKERFCWLDFQPLENEEKKELVDFLAAHTDFDARDFTEEISIIKAVLDFYPDTYLHILQDHRENTHTRKQQTEFLLQKSRGDLQTLEDIHPLYRRSIEIHQFNRQISLELKNKSQAANYLRFFTEAIQGIEGPFYILDRLDYYPNSIQNTADQYDIKVALENNKLLTSPISKRIKSSQIKLERKTKKVFYIDPAAVLYGNALYQATFTINLDQNKNYAPGYVLMTGDRPIGEPAIDLEVQNKSEFDPFLINKNKNCLEVSSEDLVEALLSSDQDALNRLLHLGAHYDEEKTKLVVKIIGAVTVVAKEIRNNLSIPKQITLIFEGDVIFFNCNFFSSVYLPGCRVKNGRMSFEGCKIIGSLVLTGAIINRPTHPKYKKNFIALNCSKLVITRDVNIDSVMLHHGSVSFAFARIKGSFSGLEMNIDYEVRFFRAKITGNLNLFKSKIRGSLWLSGVNVRSDIILNSISIDKDLNCRAIKVGVAIGLNGSQVKGNVDFSFAKLGSLFAHLSNNRSTRIGGNFSLNRIDCCWGHIEMKGIKIHGSLTMISPYRVGSFYLHGDTIGIGGFSEFVSSEIGWGITISNLVLKGDLSCYGLKVGGTRNISEKRVSQGDFKLTNSSIHGNVIFSQSKEMADNIAYYLISENTKYDILGLGQTAHEKEDSSKVLYRDISEFYIGDFSQRICLNKENILEYIRFYLFNLYNRINKEVYLFEEIDDLIWDREIYKNKTEKIFSNVQEILLESHRNGIYKVSATYIDSERHLCKGYITVDSNAKSQEGHFKIRGQRLSNRRLKVPLIHLFQRRQFYLHRKMNQGDFWQEVDDKEEKDSFLRSVSSNKLFNVTKFYNSLYKARLHFFVNGWLYAAKADLIAVKYPSEIQGDLNFSGLEVRGNISLDNIKVAHVINLANNRVQGDLSIKALKANYKNKPELEYANCSQIDLTSIEITGDADLSGLQIINRGQYPGDLKAESSRIDGTLKLVDETIDTQLQVDGTLDISSAVIANLSVSEKTFGSKKDRSVLNMQRLHTNFFDWKGGFPKHLDTKIRDLEVGAWSEDGLNNLKSILQADTSTELKRNAYTKIENTLRNQGYEEKAEDVYKEMWQRIKIQKVNDQHKPFRSRLICSFRAWFGYGRKQAFTSMWIFVVFLIISAAVFTNRENVVSTSPPDTTLLAQNNIPKHPKADYWGFGNSVWFTLRYNVPIIPFTALEQWEPNPKGIHFFGIRSHRFTAQHYAHLVELSHWIIWSIFLIYLSGIVRRGEGK